MEVMDSKIRSLSSFDYSCWNNKKSILGSVLLEFNVQSVGFWYLLHYDQCRTCSSPRRLGHPEFVRHGPCLRRVGAFGTWELEACGRRTGHGRFPASVARAFWRRFLRGREEEGENGSLSPPILCSPWMNLIPLDGCGISCKKCVTFYNYTSPDPYSNTFLEQIRGGRKIISDKVSRPWHLVSEERRILFL